MALVIDCITEFFILLSYFLICYRMNMKVDIDKIVIEKDIRKCVSKCGLLTSLSWCIFSYRT